MTLRTRFLSVVGAVALGASPAQALEIDEYPELGVFVSAMIAKHAFDDTQLRDLFEKTDIKTDIISAMQRPAEALPWHRYKQNFVTESHAKRGAHYWKENAQTLERAAREYGVAPEIILAVIGIETQYGRSTGRYRVIDALTTLMLEYPVRSDFFRRELEEYLLLTRELDIDPLSLKGSYAGAMGIGQFMPSSYRAYAIDFDNDQQRDLLGNHVDAIGSVANYFKRHGWKTGQAVIGPVKLENGFDSSLENKGLEAVLTADQLRKYGIVPVDGIAPDERAALVRLEEEDGPLYLLGYHNFYVITRYNRSRHYAMAVYELSRLIRARYDQQ